MIVASAGPLAGSLALAKMAEINPKKGATCIICAELDAASGRWELLDVVGEAGCEGQGRGQLLGGRASPGGRGPGCWGWV